MKRLMAASFILSFTLMGFAPALPGRLTAGRLAPQQVQQSKPELKTPEATPAPPIVTIEPPFVLGPAAGSPECLEGRPFKSTKPFVEAFATGRSALNKGDWDAALSAAVMAEAYAQSRPERQGAENIRAGAYLGLGEKDRALASIDRVLTANCLPPEMLAKALQMRRDLRGDLGGAEK